MLGIRDLIGKPAQVQLDIHRNLPALKLSQSLDPVFSPGQSLALVGF